MMVGDGLNDAPMSRCRALTFHCIVSASTVIFADLPQPSDPTTETTSGGIRSRFTLAGPLGGLIDVSEAVASCSTPPRRCVNFKVKNRKHPAFSRVMDTYG